MLANSRSVKGIKHGNVKYFRVVAVISHQTSTLFVIFSALHALLGFYTNHFMLQRKTDLNFHFLINFITPVCSNTALMHLGISGISSWLITDLLSEVSLHIRMMWSRCLWRASIVVRMYPCVIALCNSPSVSVCAGWSLRRWVCCTSAAMTCPLLRWRWDLCLIWQHTNAQRSPSGSSVWHKTTDELPFYFFFLIFLAPIPACIKQDPKQACLYQDTSATYLWGCLGV